VITQSDFVEVQPGDSADLGYGVEDPGVDFEGTTLLVRFRYEKDGKRYVLQTQINDEVGGTNQPIIKSAHSILRETASDLARDLGVSVQYVIMNSLKWGGRFISDYTNAPARVTIGFADRGVEIDPLAETIPVTGGKCD